MKRQGTLLLRRVFKLVRCQGQLLRDDGTKSFLVKARLRFSYGITNNVNGLLASKYLIMVHVELNDLQIFSVLH